MPLKALFLVQSWFRRVKTFTIISDDDTTSCGTPSSAGSSFFRSVDDNSDHTDSPTSKAQLMLPGSTASVPYSNNKGIIIPREIIRPIPMIPMCTAGFTTILSPPTYLENPPQLPVVPTVMIENSIAKDDENKVCI